MDVVNGSIPGCRSGNRTRVSLACNSSTVWTNRDLTKIIHVEKLGPCEVYIQHPITYSHIPYPMLNDHDIFSLTV